MPTFFTIVSNSGFSTRRVGARRPVDDGNLLVFSALLRQMEKATKEGVGRPSRTLVEFSSKGVIMPSEIRSVATSICLIVLFVFGLAGRARTGFTNTSRSDPGKYKRAPADSVPLDTLKKTLPRSE